MSIRMILFDVFGTVFDMSSLPKEDIKHYVNHVKADVWKPLELPEDWWYLKAHPDAAEGIRRLREHFTVATLSNGPVDLLVWLSKQNGIDWDWIVPIQMEYTYKPHRAAYLTVFQCFKFDPSQILLVTANPTFGDIEGAASVGMKSQVIRQPGCPQTIIELSEVL